MKSVEIRQKFFDYFTKHGHTQVASSSLIPAEDPTLLFANAGMNQFKDCFLGKEKRSYTRAVSIQKCIRAGGKHNDLDNVGRTKRHLTFFEMMGNFSFGDYFKKDAIIYAWKFLTEEVGLPAERLYISVYHNDDESYDIWHKEIGIPSERIVRLGEKDNFWQMGETGPCGPCTEIHYDKGAQTPEEEHSKVGDDGERFLEIWNLVFMQYDRQEDGTDIPLAKPGVDTGMGLERLCSIMQGVDSSFETDLFTNLIKAIEELSGKSYTASDTETQTAFRVLVDHIRSTSLAIADGGIPSNEGRGYVLRKIIRRAALFAQKLGDSMIFPQLVDPLIQEMGSFYPELAANKDMIITLLTSEIEKFSHNLEHGQVILEKYLKESSDTKTITGHQAFKLYDTFGFPLELTNIMAHQKGYSVDTTGFEAEMEQQRIQSGKKTIKDTHEFSLDPSLITKFVGYTDLTIQSPITAIIENGKSVQEIPAGKKCWIVTEESPFYVECGGQVSDTGTITFGTTDTPILDLKKVDNAIAVQVTAPTKVTVGDLTELSVDKTTRLKTIKNHTATHLLQAALVQILGPQVKQAGSLVTPEYLRFDFTHHQTITPEEILTIEELVNQKIMENIPVKTSNTTYKKALEKGVKAFFGEKYNPDDVRVVDIPGFSAELCGGAHVNATGEIGIFKIITNTALSAGTRRISAVTGPEAVKLLQETFKSIKTLAQEFKVQPNEIVTTVNKQTEELKKNLKAIKELKKEIFTYQIPQWTASTEMINNIPFGYIPLENVSGSELRDLGNLLVAEKPGIYFLVSSSAASSSFFAIIAKKFENTVNLNDFRLWLQENDFQGGGKRGSLQGGGKKPSKEFHSKLTNWLKKNITT